jgi:hypothetical protein
MKGMDMKGMDMKGGKSSGHDDKSGHSENTPHMEGMMSGKGGPEVTFATTFPSSGLYKIWAQFNYRGKIVTADYVVNVQ